MDTPAPSPAPVLATEENQSPTDRQPAHGENILPSEFEGAEIPLPTGRGAIQELSRDLESETLDSNESDDGALPEDSDETLRPDLLGDTEDPGPNDLLGDPTVQTTPINLDGSELVSSGPTPTPGLVRGKPDPDPTGSSQPGDLVSSAQPNLRPVDLLNRGTFEPDGIHDLLMDLHDGHAILLDASRTVLKISKKAKSVLGWSRRGLEGQTVELTNSLHLDKNLRRRYMRKIYEEHVPYSGKWAKLTRGSEEFSTELEATPILRNGSVHAVFEVFTVPNEKLRVEQELALEALLNEKVLALTSSLIGIIGEKGHIGFVNDRFADLIGLTRDKIAGLELKYVLGGLDQNELLNKLRNGESPRDLRVIWNFPGRHRGQALSLSADAVEIPNSNFRAFIVCLEELHVRDEYDEEIKLLGGILEAIPAPTLVTDGDLQVVIANPAAVEFLASSEELLLGESAASLLECDCPPLEEPFPLRTLGYFVGNRTLDLTITRGRSRARNRPIYLWTMEESRPASTSSVDDQTP